MNYRISELLNQIELLNYRISEHLNHIEQTLNFGANTYF